MPFRPAPNSQLIIRGRKFTVCEHPAAPGMAYGQSGRRALVYQLRDESGRYYALKVFNQTFRSVEIEQSAKNLQNYANLPGLSVCQRIVLSDAQDAALLQPHPDLRYAVLMPWVLGRTWQEVILMRVAFTPRESFHFANGLVNILAGMERAGFAHCDLSGANVLLPGLFNHQPPVELVDVEEMYLPGAQQPTRLPAGTPGYNHQTASSGLWGSEADRFSGAVLVAEMLGWVDPQIRAAALTTPASEAGEQFFPVSEMQTGCPRFDILRGRLETHWGAQIAVLFERAWHSAQLVDCPSFAEWQSAFSALDSRLPILEETSQHRHLAQNAPLASKVPKRQDSATPITKDKIISISHPKRISKGYTANFLVQIYPSCLDGTAKKLILAEFKTREKETHNIETQFEQKSVTMRFISPVFEFPEIPKKMIVSRDKVTSASIIVIPKSDCRPGLHQVAFVLLDNKDVMILSKSFTVSVVDYAFGRVSRPLLSNIISGIASLGALAMFILAFLGQIDTTLGFTSGTAAGAVASFLFIRMNSLYRQLQQSNP